MIKVLPDGTDILDEWPTAKGWIIGDDGTLSVTVEGEIVTTYASMEWKKVIDQDLADRSYATIAKTERSHEPC